MNQRIGNLLISLFCLLLISLVEGKDEKANFLYALVKASKTVLLPNPHYPDYMLTDIFINSDIPQEIRSSYERRFFVSLLNYKNRKLYLLPGSFSNWLNKNHLITYGGKRGDAFFIYFFDPENKTLLLKHKITSQRAFPFTIPLQGGICFLFQKSEFDRYSLCIYNLSTNSIKEIYYSDTLVKDFEIIPKTNKLLCIEETDDTLTKVLLVDIDNYSTTSFVLNLPNVSLARINYPDDIYILSLGKDNRTALYKLDIMEERINLNFIDSDVGGKLSTDEKYLYLTKIEGTKSMIIKLDKHSGNKEFLPVSINSHNVRKVYLKNTFLYFVSPHDVLTSPIIRLSNNVDILYELKDGVNERIFEFSSIIWLPIEGGTIE